MLQAVMWGGRGKGIDFFIKRLKLGPLGSFLHLTLSTNGRQVDGGVVSGSGKGYGGEGWR